MHLAESMRERKLLSLFPFESPRQVRPWRHECCSWFFRTIPAPQPITPKSGQELVWDFPRPPRIERSSDRVIVKLGGQVIADTTDAVRVLETSHPPAYYLPMSSFPANVLVPAESHGFMRSQRRASDLPRWRLLWRMDNPADCWSV